jgi:methylated-DNA-[protein]-cysteine S-methyltransferase
MTDQFKTEDRRYALIAHSGRRAACWRSPIGRLIIAEDGRGISDVFFTVGEHTVNSERELTPLLRRAINELDEYFKGRRREFELPLSLDGTAFQQAVWQALTEIPYGQTRSYGEIAAAIGNPRACRAVGMANNRNPVAIIIPCHRVIGSDGSPVGYAGGTDIKERLLELESGVKQRHI